MKVVELVGKDIMTAYDGNYLSKNFGYSCANFNVKNDFGNLKGYGGIDWSTFEQAGFGDSNAENPPHSFDFYTENTKNISCFVCYDNNGKIAGRRMFYKGKSMLNDDEYDLPIKMGAIVKYLYGYYGDNIALYQDSITRACFDKYGKGIVYTDRGPVRNKSLDHTIPKYWVMQVEKADFPQYPPVDLLQVSVQLKALANFDPNDEVLEMLKNDFKVKDASFSAAYRYSPRKAAVKYNYTTWDKHKGVITDMKDFTTVIPEEKPQKPIVDIDNFDDLEGGDKLISIDTKKLYKVKSVSPVEVKLQSLDGKQEWGVPRRVLHKLYYRSI